MVVLALRRSGCCTALAKAEWWRPGGLARDRYALRKSHEMRGRSWSWALGRAPPRNDAAMQCAIQWKSRGIDRADQAFSRRLRAWACCWVSPQVIEKRRARRLDLAWR